MLVIMHAACSTEDCARVESQIRQMGFVPLRVPGANRTAICITGNRAAVDPDPLLRLPGVLECIRVTRPWKLVIPRTPSCRSGGSPSAPIRS
jgi:3-deoxy-7-phosphoheptulonate synthase